MNGPCHVFALAHLMNAWTYVFELTDNDLSPPSDWMMALLHSNHLLVRRWTEENLEKSPLLWWQSWCCYTHGVHQIDFLLFSTSRDSLFLFPPTLFVSNIFPQRFYHLCIMAPSPKPRLGTNYLDCIRMQLCPRRLFHANTTLPYYVWAWWGSWHRHEACFKSLTTKPHWCI